MSKDKHSTLWVVQRMTPDGNINVRAYRKQKRADKYADLRTKQAKIAKEENWAFTVDRLILVEGTDD